MAKGKPVGSRPSRGDKRKAVTRQAQTSESMPVKRKKPSTEVAIIPDDPKIEKNLRRTMRALKDLKGKKSDFKLDLRELNRLIDSGSTDDLQKQFYSTALKSLIGVIPLAEDKMRNAATEGTAYAMNALLSQAREILHDLRALDDSGQVAFKISSTLVDPSYTAMANTFLGLLSDLRDQTEAYVPNDKRMKFRQIFQSSARQWGEYLSASRDTLKAGIAETIG